MEAVESFVATDSNDSLCITTFGKSRNKPGHCWGPDVRSYYLLHYIVSGKGVFQTYGADGKTYKLEAGQGFLIEPAYVTRYESSQDEPWSYIWVGFSGSKAPDIIRGLYMNQDAPIFTCSEQQGAHLVDCVEKMLAYRDGSFTSIFRQLEYFYSFIATLTESSKNPAPVEKDNNYTHQCVDYIRSHLSEQFSVQDLADHIGLSRTYLTYLFKHNLQMSPQEYIISNRLNQACRLLESTQLPVEAVALQCGYASNNTFSKSFQKNMLMSPTAYRQFCKKNNTYPNPKENPAGIEK